ncbi:hypothetical protein CAPTEDRAFT_222937 [Capitella teleta]|uniref:VWFD domain-containing protein n=1 Tax=Capitella teleta TaxID=283909 RepID=X2ATS3_CAPTE|nr:hypothetical protein CAPTEDRAFT_222937 [Capitella teleta]|eukprot:ELU04650.1 hypothetical protein CAPTEDRAFT_222937 [Capitella teleta]
MISSLGLIRPTRRRWAPSGVHTALTLLLLLLSQYVTLSSSSDLAFIPSDPSDRTNILADSIFQDGVNEIVLRQNKIEATCSSTEGPLYCLTCLNARTEAECKAKGTLVECDSDEPICAVFTLETEHETKVFSRMCHSRPSCVTSVLGPKGKVCDDVAGKAVCTYCEFGKKGEDFTCGLPLTPTRAPSPCDQKAGEIVWCRSCTNVANEEECRSSGSMIECQSVDHMCGVTTNEDSEGSVKRYNRACKPIDQCPKSTVVANPKNCTGHGDSLHCNYCNYGVLDLDYDCAEASPREASPCDESHKEGLWCHACSGARNETHCKDIGHFERCKSADSVCEITVHQNVRGELVDFNRGCQARSICKNPSLGEKFKICSSSGDITSCSYCDLGKKDEDYLCSSAPCEEENGESLWCLSCHDARDLFDCILKGTFTQCLGEQMTCMSEIVSEAGRPSRFNRRCASNTRCPALHLGQENQVCRNDGDDQKCTYCDYGLPNIHYECKPDVCDFKRNETLHCLTCHESNSMEECLINGEFQACEGDQPICETKITSLGQNVVGYSRRCQSRSECPAGGVHIGSSVKECARQAGVKMCTHCDHGSLGSTYYCSQDGQFENALVCPGDDPANCYTSLEASPTPGGPVPDATSAKEDSIGSSRTRREIVMEDVIEGSGESSGGSGSGWMNDDETMCSSELGEVPACWTCQKAASDAECWAKGSFQPCLMPDPTCEYKFSTTKQESGDGELVEVTRQCSSKDWCSSHKMEPDSAVTYDLFGFHKRAEEVVETYRICGEETYDVEYVCVDPTEHRRSKRDTTSANPAPIVSCHTGAAERYTCHTSADQPFQFTSFDGRSVSFDGDCKYLLSGTPSDNGFSPVPQYQIFLKREQGGRSVAYVEVIFGDNIERINIRLLPGNVIQVNDTEILPRDLPQSFQYSEEDVITLVKTGSNHISIHSRFSTLTLGYDGRNGISVQLPKSYLNRNLKGLCGNLNGLWADDLTASNGDDVSMLGLDAGQAYGYSWQVVDEQDLRQVIHNYFGTKCSELESCQCQNGGVCVPHFGVCHCPSHTTGLQCQYNVSSQCTAAEEPSFRTFDGQEFDYTGPCVYLLASTSSSLPSNLRPFKVFVQNEKEELMITHPEGRKTRSVQIEHGSTSILLEPHSTVTIDGRRIESELYKVENGYIKRTGNSNIRVVLDLGLTLVYDGFYQVDIQVTEAYEGYLQGLCGNMDDSSLDDLTNSCGHDVAGLQEDSGRAMAESWQVEDTTHDINTCRNQPVCDSCNGGLYVTETGKCRCPVNQAGPQCQFSEFIYSKHVSSQCVALGDPHYRTFDGAMLHYQGACRYLMSGTTDDLPEVLVPFKAYIKNEHQDRASNRGSWTHHVEVVINGHTIYLDRFFNVMVDGLVVHLPHRSISGVDIIMHQGTSVQLKTYFGFTVNINNIGRVTIRLPLMYSGYVKGLCGNYNYIYYDDYTTQDGEYVGNNKNARGALVGNSWKTVEKSEPGCYEPFEDDIPDTSKLSPNLLNNHAHCDIMFNTSLAGNPFASCIPRLGNMSLLYLEACVYAAAVAGEAELLKAGQPPPTCRVLSAFADECRFKAGVNVPDWRWRTQCPLECPTGMEASARVSAAPKHCGQSPMIFYESLEGPGCGCPNGMMLSGIQCKLPTQCGCTTMDGFYHQLNSKWLSHDCSAINKCAIGKRGYPVVMTRPYECPGNGECSVDKGKMTCRFECNCQNGGECIPSSGKCRCPTNFMGKHCETEISCCQAWGDPHYQTYQGLTVDFMGSCRYQLTGTCPNSGNFDSFLVTAINAIPENHAMASLVKEISVEISGHRVDISLDGTVQVDEEIVSPPLAMDDLTIHKTPSHILMETPQLMVRYGRQKAEVCIPKKTLNTTQLCGICGSKNGSAEKELSSEFKYRVNYDHDEFCQRPLLRELLGGVPHFEASWKTRVEMNPQFCGLLYPFIRSGPFLKCWQHLDTKTRSAYHSGCRYAVYLMSGSQAEDAHQVSCRSLEAVAESCNKLGFMVEWRDEAQCTPLCPNGQVFHENTSSCPATCQNPLAPSLCPIAPTAACTCPPGQLRLGNVCVEPEKCGCFDKTEVYHPPNSWWYNDDCSSKYVCQPATSLVGSEIQKRLGCNFDNETCALVDGLRTCLPTKVDGRWSEWEEWSECVASPLHPDLKSRLRMRSCDNPAPSNGGEHCEGPAFQHDTADCQPIA